MLDSGTTKPIIQEIRRALDNVDGGAAAVGGAAMKEGGNHRQGYLYKLLLIDKLDNVLARDVAVNNQIYNTLLATGGNSQDHTKTAVIKRREHATRFLTLRAFH